MLNKLRTVSVEHTEKFRYAVYALDQKHTQKESLHLMLTFSVPDDAT